jgi:hypothetical protein
MLHKAMEQCIVSENEWATQTRTLGWPAFITTFCAVRLQRFGLLISDQDIFTLAPSGSVSHLSGVVVSLTLTTQNQAPYFYYQV